MRYCMSIDPGFGDGTGWALWESGDQWNKCVPPVNFGILTARGPGSQWVNRCLRIGASLSTIMLDAAPDKMDRVYCEFPQLFSSAKSHAAASKGNLFQLSFLIGVFAQVACDHSASFHPVEVNTWKGQMEKDAVAERVALRLHEEIWSYPDHANDAVGLGLHVKGHFTK